MNLAMTRAARTPILAVKFADQGEIHLFDLFLAAWLAAFASRYIRRLSSCCFARWKGLLMNAFRIGKRAYE